jgi:hypothetical protein
VIPRPRGIAEPPKFAARIRPIYVRFQRDAVTRLERGTVTLSAANGSRIRDSSRAQNDKNGHARRSLLDRA